jgi:hypothetical protein
MEPKTPTSGPSLCDGIRTFCCPSCDAPVGSADGRRLTVGAVILDAPINLTCVACRHPYEWKPEITNTS